MTNELAPIPEMLSISPFGIAIYNDYSYLRKDIQSEKVSMPKSNEHNGTLSPAGKKNLRNAIGYLILKTQRKHRTKKKLWPKVDGKIGFLTLTLPSKQVHSDTEIKSICLDHFLTELRQVYNVSEYVWRAEKQKNGNIHFHILVNVFLPHQDIRDRWNRIIEKLGYVTAYANKHRQMNFEDYLLAYPLKPGKTIQEKKKVYSKGVESNWTDPNSTDVHKLNHVHNAGLYIAKYAGKGPRYTEALKKKLEGVKLCADDIEKIIFENEIAKEISQENKAQAIEGRIWFASESLTKVKSYKIELNSCIKEYLGDFLNATNAREVKNDFCFWYNRGIEDIIRFGGDLAIKIDNYFFGEQLKIPIFDQCNTQ